MKANSSTREFAQKEVAKLERKYANRLEKNSTLNRSVVSFQANKAEPIFRWFKYREGFSRTLIDYCLDSLSAQEGNTILDPFAGTGATVFTAAERGINGIAIELLPVGAYFMQARQYVINTQKNKIIKYATDAVEKTPWNKAKPTWRFPHLKITQDAFPTETEEAIAKYKTYVQRLPPEHAQLMDFVLFSVLEEISYTRKDGQYLRWDGRAPRARLRSNFNKGKIFAFDEAICGRLRHIIHDLSDEYPQDLFTRDALVPRKPGAIRIWQGSNFEKVNDLGKSEVDYVITSPPYCNRYDYTRTYALELAYLGVDEIQLKHLRQSLLTCTVEHRAKDFSALNEADFECGKRAFESSNCLAAVLAFLEAEKKLGLLNNDGILTMVKGYFYDTAMHLAQMFPKMRKGGSYVMVNDNVRYNGLDVPVDCLLSEIAEAVGFVCEKIWVLPIGKGNSSQQMKKHGRSEQRKCVYIWRKP